MATTEDLEHGFGTFPSPRYKAEDIRKIDYGTFCQCNADAHKIRFPGEETTKRQRYCHVSCYHGIAAVARACQYKNTLDGMILYRGGKVHYDTEICTFWRNNDPRERKMFLMNLLLMTFHLSDHYSDYPNNKKEGAKSFNSTSILSTIISLAVLQHYSEDLNDTLNGKFIATPMLDCTRDVRVAASFALMGHGTNSAQGVVRFLFVPPPKAIDTKSNKNKYWNEIEGLGINVQKLGDTNMILVDLTSIFFASAVRPLNQSGYLIIHEHDCISFHELRLDVEAKWDVARNSERDKWKALNEILSNHAFLNDRKMNEFVAEKKKWDALQQRVVDVCFRKGEPMTPDTFFHGLESTYEDSTGKIVERMENPFPFLSRGQLYPNKDPMKDLMTMIADKAKKYIFTVERILIAETIPVVPRKIRRQRLQRKS